MMGLPWAGAWEWLSDEYDGRPTLLERYFCYVFAQKERQPPEGGHPTEAEAAALFRSMGGAAAGTITSTQEADEWLIEMLSTVELLPLAVGTRLPWAFRVEGDRMFGQVITGDGTRTPAFTYRRLSGPGSTSLAGAWELVSDEWDGIILMTHTEYRYLLTRKDRPQVAGPASDMSDADAADLYHSFDAQGGSYTVSGSTMTRLPVVARDPRQKGREIPVKFKVKGEALTTWTAQEELVWRELD